MSLTLEQQNILKKVVLGIEYKMDNDKKDIYITNPTQFQDETAYDSIDIMYRIVLKSIKKNFGVFKLNYKFNGNSVAIW